jgi:AraC-like DNA-binding protein
MSRSSFQRAFRRVLSTSPVDYWIRLRVERARALLAGGTVRIKEAAAAAGFEDSNYFARQFRHIHGVSPRDYARRATRSRPGRTAGGGERFVIGRKTVEEEDRSGCD